MMKYFKQYGLALLIFLLVALLIMIRNFNQKTFKYDAVRLAESSVNGSNILIEDQIPNLSGEILLINLGEEPAINKKFNVNTLMINPEFVLEKANLKIIRKNKGPVILFSERISVSARVWMVLTEMGIKNLYILTDDGMDK